MSDQKYMARLLSEGIKPHSKAISNIAAAGDIAVVAFEPNGEARLALHVLGWNGRDAVFGVSCARALQASTGEDPRADRWLARAPREREIKILAVTAYGSLPINSTPEGYSVEPEVVN